MSEQDVTTPAGLAELTEAMEIIRSRWAEMVAAPSMCLRLLQAGINALNAQAAELEKLRAIAYEALAMAPENADTEYSRHTKNDPVGLLAESYTLLKEQEGHARAELAMAKIEMSSRGSVKWTLRVMAKLLGRDETIRRLQAEVEQLTANLDERTLQHRVQLENAQRLRVEVERLKQKSVVGWQTGKTIGELEEDIKRMHSDRVSLLAELAKLRADTEREVERLRQVARECWRRDTMTREEMERMVGDSIAKPEKPKPAEPQPTSARCHECGQDSVEDDICWSCGMLREAAPETATPPVPDRCPLCGCSEASPGRITTSEGRVEDFFCVTCFQPREHWPQISELVKAASAWDVLRKSSGAIMIAPGQPSPFANGLCSVVWDDGLDPVDAVLQAICDTDNKTAD